MRNKIILEFTGTFFLTLTYALTGNPLAIGAVFAAMIYMSSGVNAGQCNPATTLVLLMLKKIIAREAGLVLLAQILGAAAASLAYHLLYGATRVFFLSPDSRINILKPLFTEGLFTFALMLVILFTTVAKKAAGNSYYGLVIGLTLTGLMYAGANISGGVFNPAVGFMPVLMESLLGVCQCHPMQYAWIYLAGPFLGAIAAAVLFRFILMEEV
jgi:aquaporin Z